MSVRLKLIDVRTDTRIEEGDYAAVPQVGTEIMVLRREWEIYGVEGVRLWPGRLGDAEVEVPDTPPTAWVYVRHHGSVD